MNETVAQRLHRKATRAERHSGRDAEVLANTACGSGRASKEQHLRYGESNLMPGAENCTRR